MALDGFHPDRIWAAKIEHARAVPRYDLALFGNSRSIMVSAADLGLSCRFFNLSMPGESFRNSVEMLEALSRQGSAPAIAVISLDNFELQYMGHPELPPLALRMRRAFLDVAFAIGDGGTSTRDAARMAWRHVLVTWQRMKALFTADYVVAALRRAATLDWRPPSLPVGSVGGYLLDGSRASAATTAERSNVLPRPFAHSVIPGLLRHDQARLAALLRHGHVDRVAIYESPLSPQNSARLLAEPTPVAAQDRAAFLKSCRELGLHCRPAVMLDARENDWADADHPPAAALGGFMRGWVADMGGCGS